jgi:hypothetical protein
MPAVFFRSYNPDSSLPLVNSAANQWNPLIKLLLEEMNVPTSVGNSRKINDADTLIEHYQLGKSELQN